MTFSKGFTLIEVMAAGTASSVIAGAILSLLYMKNTQLEESIAIQKAVQSYGVAAEYIRRTARSAYTVRSYEEATPWTFPPPATGHLPSLLSLIFYDTAGTAIGGVQYQSLSLTKGYLQELVGNAWVPFKIGSDTLLLAPNQAFTILANRRGVRFRLEVAYSLKGAQQRLISPRETVLCRNIP